MVLKNQGNGTQAVIKMVYKAARNVEYQSVLGMNVLTIRLTP